MTLRSNVLIYLSKRFPGWKVEAINHYRDYIGIYLQREGEVILGLVRGKMSRKAFHPYKNKCKNMLCSLCRYEPEAFERYEQVMQDYTDSLLRDAGTAHLFVDNRDVRDSA